MSKTDAANLLEEYDRARSEAWAFYTANLTLAGADVALANAVLGRFNDVAPRVRELREKLFEALTRE